ncbi:EamA family transporter [Alicyclobacillus fastidiosus]|uniref:EamA family transporter n=1 Tax=Alicyclobacillus fastidiosus TaxID=392011 RepID=A0ABV5ADD2_9BACL|nr:EamA family transporter [Alicyclobacillus fastidiosus]WEH08707.1 EamA family transporter [Alicyclobacillus fastidiosus]
MLGQVTAVLSAVCYALSHIFIRKGQADSSPADHGLLPVLSISALLLDFSCVIVRLVHLTSRPLDLHGIWMPVLFAALSGIIGTTLGRLALYRAMEDLGVTRGVVIKGLSPIVTLLIVLFALRQPILRGDLIGLGCLALCIVLLFIERQVDTERHIPLRIFQNSLVIAGLSAVAQGVGHTFRQFSVNGALLPLYASAIDVSVACIGYLLFLAVTRRLRPLLSHYRNSSNASLLAAGLFSALAVLLFFTAVQQIPVSTVSILAATEPVIVALFSVLFFPKLERITWWSASAAVVVAAGVVLISL